MRRRDFIAGLLAAAAMRSVQAPQTGKVYRMAFIDGGIPLVKLREIENYPGYQALVEELRSRGYVEAQNLSVAWYSGEGLTEHFPELARDVVRSNPDVIVATPTTLVLALKAASTTIPIVGITGDPIAYGVVSSIARPGGNVTGVSVDVGLDIWGKRLELLKKAIPGVSRVGLVAPRSWWETASGAALGKAAQRLGISLVGQPLATVEEAEYRRVFATIVKERAEAIIVGDPSQNFDNARLIVELAMNERLPAMYPYRRHVELGGLIAYAMDIREIGRRVAAEVDQILKGVKPGEIPFYQQSKYDLVVNLRAAKVLGIEIPPSLLAEADEVIE